MPGAVYWMNWMAIEACYKSLPKIPITESKDGQIGIDAVFLRRTGVFRQRILHI